MPIAKYFHIFRRRRPPRQTLCTMGLKILLCGFLTNFWTKNFKTGMGTSNLLCIKQVIKKYSLDPLSINYSQTTIWFLSYSFIELITKVRNFSEDYSQQTLLEPNLRLKELSNTYAQYLYSFQTLYLGGIMQCVSDVLF